MRTFIEYDEDGEIVAVLKTESLPEGRKQPFYLEGTKHGALEVSGDAEVAKLDGGAIAKGFKVDVAKRKLVEKSAAKSTATKKTAAKKSAAKKTAKKGARRAAKK